MSEFIEKYQTVFGTLTYTLFIALIFTLPLPWQFTQPIYLAWAISWLLEGRWTQKQYFRWDKGHLPLCLSLIFIGWCALSLGWTTDFQQGVIDLSKYLCVAGVFVVSLWGVNDHYRPIRLKTTLFVAGLVSVLAYCVTLLCFHSIKSVCTISPNFVIRPWTMFGDLPLVVIKHRLYYCMVLALCFAFSGDIYRHYRQTYPKMTAILTIGIADLVLLSTIVLTGSRTMMLLIPILCILMVIRYLKGKRRIVGIVVVATIMTIIGTLFVHYNSRVTETITENRNVSLEAIQQHPLDYEPRLYLHSTVLRHMDCLGWKGLGLGTAQEFMMACYQEDQLPEMIAKQYGPHNQFLNILIELGPLAVVFFIFILIYTPFCYRSNTRWDAVFMVLTITWGLLTETALSRISGIYILTAMCMLLMIEHRLDTHTKD